MPKLTVLKIKSAKEPCRLPDGYGLSFEITKTGVKRWLYRYRLDDKQQMLIIGRYPEMSLENARKMHREARALVLKGLNPSKERKKEKQSTIIKEQKKRDDRTKSFKYITLEWIEKQSNDWSQDHKKSVISSLQNDIFPSLGNRPVDGITPPEILKVLREIEGRGSLEIVRKVLQRTNAVFRYAIQTGRATYNPAADMQGALKKKTVRHMPAVFNAELGQLLRDITANQTIHVVTKLAIQFTALTACRGGEVRKAHWQEIHTDLGEWHIPAERMKMRRPHIVPLSSQALAVLNRAEKLWGANGFVFPSIRDSNKPMSDNAMGKAFRDMGYKGKATPHGFRASFSSISHEQSSFASEVIEKALAHEEKNKVKGAYNRAEYLEQRRELLQWWGDTLHKLEHT